MIEKKLPIGIEDFEKIRTAGFYYVDKTGLIKELLHNWGEVNLFTRPRRFGKTLNMSMLKNFFEIDCMQELFDGLEIANETALCEEYMGKFPVVSISLKSVNGIDYETARAMICSVIGNEAIRFQFLLSSDKLTEKDKLLYDQLTMVGERNQDSFVMSDDILVGSLKTLSSLLYKYYGKKVIILIDEYDVPLAKAFENGYYDRMVELIRNIFMQVLKTNENMYFAVLTGCLRVSKESIFTGLNNPNILSIMDVEFDEYFGFTDQEVRNLLEEYQLSGYYDTIKEWYDGYRFGNVEVYCPWDVICYCQKLRHNPQAQPEAYWSNTSSNDIIRRFIEMAKSSTKREMEALLAGESVEKVIRQELTYKELYDSVDNVWSVLFTTGYLTQRGKPEGKKLQLVIPNLEIRSIFEEQVMEWFRESVQRDGMALAEFCEVLKDGNAAGVEKKFSSYLRKTISIRDTFVKNRKENFYHGILLGILGYKDEWDVSSNKESGEGYSDIQVIIEDEEIGIMIELKYADDGDLDAGCAKALKQIEDNKYEENLLDAGMQTILKYGIACYQKRCKVVLAEE